MKRSTFMMLCLTLSMQGLAQLPNDPQLTPLPDRVKERYLLTEPHDFLLDPQRILRGNEAKERREFLKYHSSDSLIDLHVVLFKGDQLLMDQGRLSSRHRTWMKGNKPSVFIHYFMGQPERTEMYLSPRLDEVVPLDERSRALSNAVERAKTGVSPLDELEKFMVQTSIRIIRMERVLNEGTVGPAPLVSDSTKVVDENQADRASLVKVLRDFWSAWNYKLIGVLVAIGGIWFLLRWRKLRSTHHFPDSIAEERLGGAHGAGVGAVLQFGKASKPPAAQLERLRLH